ncbi:MULTISPECIES: hypothetical protein [unclassified Nocardia]|uniref:hypothetical protein n=1 Tax=unclassified Nocardia TaxID=2637762 RepID=UPI001CE41620|nr:MULTISPECIES: hypothetical protein [unclassified Nocardia]
MTKQQCRNPRCQHGLIDTVEVAQRLGVTKQLVLQWRSQPKPHALADKGFRLNGDSRPLRWIECDYFGYLDAMTEPRSA